MTPYLKLALSLVFAAFFSIAAVADVVDYDANFGVLSFEQGTFPAVAGRHSSISQSSLHYKLGSHSLEWTWNRPGSTLNIPRPIPYLSSNPDPKETSVSTFVFWIYSKDAIDGELRFSFRKNGRECCFFYYKLGFKGWRGAWVAFDRDMTGTPQEGMDEVVITSPVKVKKGKLWFDGIITSAFEDVRYHTADWQAPFINANTTVHWLVLNNSWNLKLDIPLSELKDNQIADMQTITERFVQLVTPAKRVSTDSLRRMFKSYDISVNPDGTITGKPIFFTRYGETFINLGIPDASVSFKKNGQLLRNFNNNLLDLATAYQKSTDETERQELARMYVLMTMHLLDQGFAAGSAQGTLHHLGYSMRNFYIAPVLMRDVLVQAGMLDQVQAAMEWFSGVGEVKVAPENPGMDIDAFNTSLMGRLASILILEPSSYKYAYMRAISRWIDNGFKYVDGTLPCFKSDGSIYHHRRAYPAYAVGGLDGAVNAVWMLRGTTLAISEESHGILKESLMQMRFWCNLRSFPLAMSGRHPDGKGELNPYHYALLADAGTPDRKSTIDPDLACAFLRLTPDSPKAYRQWTDKFHKEGFSAENTPQGSRSYPYNCSLSHRYGQSLVTFAGHSRYLWAAEIYNGANHYGRYLTHGSMQILGDGQPVINSFGSGYQVDGWDWCHIPGTTAAAIPMTDMKAVVLNVDEHSGYEEMLLSDEWFAGGVTHKGSYGAFAMKLHEHDKYNGSLRARKSYFAFDGRIIALGSNLENALPDSELHTTLFQNSLDEEDCQVSISEEKTDSLVILNDHFGNAYLIRNATVRTYRGIQHSLHEETDKPTQGFFEKAYIHHGDIVKDAGYEYMVALHGDKAMTDEWTKTKPYKVIRKDRRAHVVRDIKSGVTGCVVFESGDVDSFILSSTPAMIMYSTDQNCLTLSVCNPDLALYEGEADEVYDENGKRTERSVYGRKWIDSHCLPTSVTIRLSGNWQISSPTETSVEILQAEGDTILTIHSREAKTEELVLKKAK